MSWKPHFDVFILDGVISLFFLNSSRLIGVLDSSFWTIVRTGLDLLEL